MSTPTSEQRHAQYVKALEEAIKPLADIADEYDKDGLDEARPSWLENGAERFSLDVELYSGRGGKKLISLRDAMQARLALTGKPISNMSLSRNLLKAQKLYEALYTGGSQWNNLPQDRRDEVIRKVEAMIAAGELQP